MFYGRLQKCWRSFGCHDMGLINSETERRTIVSVLFLKFPQKILLLFNESVGVVATSALLKLFKMEFKQDEIVLVSNNGKLWRPAFYCFKQDDLHRVAFMKTDTNRVGSLECFKYIKKCQDQ